MNIPLDQDWIEAFLLASVRMVAFLVIAPPFSYNAFPARVKAMIGLGLALAVAPQLSQGYSALDTGAFFMALVLELLVGALLGFLVMVVFSAVQSAGNLIDTFGGFQLAQAFDPQSMVNGAQFTRIFQITALALLFASDGYQLIIGGLLRSFTALPLAGGVDLAEPVSALATSVSQMFLASVQIAGPLLVVLFLADAGLGLLTRVAPALNAFALGFPLKILLTLTLASMVFLALPRIVSSMVSTIVRAVTGVG
ncbi:MULTISPECIES: flagellar biosynthetic protein FliR [unclassified Arthrobacter]|uniref:flagellar biosynthetic protein FliR n=1 Tax=unclassified Arthrobacter TaxID=235627 RepID=UPI001D13B946|nr:MULTISPECIES: flagellar biosynthetic protein FliR [unclassified Arthrobacter]MCC3276471.1 flagellar biosynthetic protein FliR [Arthrobacter sp. zg-Y20]MCC9178547.1 flagellar biosynthetic protein FliR [Arthrobacter sp. zg-Y750]MDK1316631.1 flagellar biosynthetic protein FliR [Arthrobacter sp. zg.Y20]WIB06669.1 flagellar biosynthetic protein FliR [Arthrobacter sp. zg-Y20]